MYHSTPILCLLVVRAGTSLKGRVVCEVIAKDIIQGEPVHLVVAGKERVHKTSGKRKCVFFDDYVFVE